MTTLTSSELNALMLWADEMIPGDGEWPTPSAAGIDVFFERIFGNADDVARVRRALRGLAGDGPPPATSAERVEALRRLDAQEPLVFRALQEFVYFGYYSRPRVVSALNDILGCDYVSPPQPFGYAMSRDGDPEPTRRGAYTPTEAVVRVDLAGLETDAAGDEAIKVGANPRFGNSATLFT